MNNTNLKLLDRVRICMKMTWKGDSESVLRKAINRAGKLVNIRDLCKTPPFA